MEFNLDSDRKVVNQELSLSLSLWQVRADLIFETEVRGGGIFLCSRSTSTAEVVALSRLNGKAANQSAAGSLLRLRDLCIIRRRSWHVRLVLEQCLQYISNLHLPLLARHLDRQGLISRNVYINWF